MNYIQIIPFNTSLGGNVSNMCLANVAKGYGIGNKYSSAWQAWEHTQQHTDPVPTGLAVPIYYSYTATIDGVTENYGHINVQLPNGTVWSDGNIYASIDDYTSKKLPKFVGWGESINDYKIIQLQGVSDMIPDLGHLDALFQNFIGRPSNAAEQAEYLGSNQPGYSVLIERLNDPKNGEWQTYHKIIALGYETQKGATKLPPDQLFTT